MLALALVSGSPGQVALIMLGFGLGTAFYGHGGHHAHASHAAMEQDMREPQGK